MKLLFVSGPARSGTTAFADYLNQHQEILVCRERYKYVPRKIDSSFFTFDRILDYEPQQRSGETNIPVEYHAELLAKKDPAKLKWIGDKHPGYARFLPEIYLNNPGASFILTYRPIEEVVESFDARSKNPDDPWLGDKNGFELGVEYWNRTMRSTREFIESGLNPNVLIISYHDFFYRNEDCIPLISRFLDLEFDDSIRNAWREMSHDFEGERRQKEPFNDEQVAFIEKRKDYVAERWVLDRIEEQWRELDGHAGAGRGILSQPRTLGTGLESERAETATQAGRIWDLEHQVQSLKNSLSKEQRRAEMLQKKNRNLKHQMQQIQSSRSWRLLGKIGQIRARVLGKKKKG
jgi:hypothetical protein